MLLNFKCYPKKTVVTAMLVYLSMGVFVVHGQQSSFTLTVKMNKPLNGHKMFLYYVKGSDSNGVDSVAYDGHKFELKGKTAQPQKAFFCIAPANKGFKYNYTKPRAFVYLEAGHITVETEPFLRELKLGGTPLNIDLQKFADVLNAFVPRQDSLRRLQTKAYQQRDTAMLTRMSAEFSKWDADRKKAQEKFFFEHPGSLAALEWLTNTVNIAQDKTKAREMFAKMTPAVRNSSIGKAYSQRLKATQSVEMGSKAPDFTSTDLNNQNVSLSSFRGKYVLLDFWASWCVPCRKENPNVIRAYHRFKSENFTIVGFSLDDEKAPWINAVEKDGLPWTQLCDTKAERSPVSLMYGVSAIPSNFLIDPTGKIIAKNLRGEELEKKLSSIFNSSSKTN